MGGDVASHPTQVPELSNQLIPFPRSLDKGKAPFLARSKSSPPVLRTSLLCLPPSSPKDTRRSHLMVVEKVYSALDGGAMEEDSNQDENSSKELD